MNTTSTLVGRAVRFFAFDKAGLRFRRGAIVDATCPKTLDVRATDNKLFRVPRSWVAPDLSCSLNTSDDDCVVIPCGAPAVAYGGGGAAPEFALCGECLEHVLAVEPDLEFSEIDCLTRRLR